VSTLDQLSAATEGKITVQSVLQLLGAVEEEALFRLCDLVVDQDTAGALTFVEELAAQGQDLGRLVLDLLEHLRALMLVQHMGEVPDSLPLTEETRDRLRAQANQLGEPTVVRLIDLLAVAVEDMRQGGDPRLPLELALVKVTRPAADLSRESMAYRLDQIERGRASHVAVSDTERRPEEPSAPASEPPPVELTQLQEAWQRSVLPAIESIPTASMFAEGRPTALDDASLPRSRRTRRCCARRSTSSRAASSSSCSFSARASTATPTTTTRRARKTSTSSSRTPSTRER
jgi:DNA polymerase-3 subunit gamma/tau